MLFRTAILAGVAIGAGKLGIAMVSAAVGVAIYANFLRRIAHAHFGWRANLLALFGLPFFSSLLLRSAIYYGSGRRIRWRGREYDVGTLEGRPEETAAPSLGR